MTEPTENPNSMSAWEAWTKTVPQFAAENINEDLRAFGLFIVKGGANPLPMACLVKTTMGVQELESMVVYAGSILMGDYIKRFNFTADEAHKIVSAKILEGFLVERHRKAMII